MYLCYLKIENKITKIKYNIMKKILSLLITAMLLAAPAIEAKVVLPHILGSNMVLQQQTNVKLWGKATNNTKVTVITSWNNKKYSCMSDNSGNWILAVETPEAGGPFTLKFNDGETLELTNIMIGEVWFCSGQSNMEMPVKGYGSMPVTNNNEILAKAKASVPIRMFTAKRQSVKTPMDDDEGEWKVNEPANVGDCSATAYFFARFLQDVLEVPVGIVVSSWGGSAIEAWMNPEAVKEVAPEISLAHLTPEGKIKYQHQDAALLYNGMIHPFLNLTFRGMIWYQGEANNGRPVQYRKLMKGFVKELRSEFSNGDFPFYYVQISPFRYGGVDLIGSSYLREAQMLFMNDMPNVGMACTMDIPGEVYNIHPRFKDIVGARLAYWALAKTYGKTGFSYCGPIYKSMTVKDGKATISFDHADNNLVPFSENIAGFEIAGADSIFHEAKAVSHGQTVEVSCDAVKEPVAVRYCFKNFCTGTLFNTYGLPASSFRTDDWPIDVKK